MRAFRTRSRRWSLRLTLAFSSFVMCTSASAQWAGASRDTLTRDLFRDENTMQSLAVDAVNTLHAVWQRAITGGWRIFYARKPDGSGWAAPREVGDSSQFSNQSALAVDFTTGTPHIAYRANYASNDEIVVAKDSAGSWRRLRLTTNSTQDLAPTITVDSLGRVHVAWIGQDASSNWKIMYATNTGGGWQAQLLTMSELGQFGSGALPFIAVTSSGRTHIFYRGGSYTDYHIHHASNSAPGDTTWTYEIISTPNANDFSASAVIDAQGTIHLLASGNDGFGFPPHVYYLKKSGSGSWTTPELASVGGNGWGGLLVIDRFGKGHITWNETSGNIYTGNLFYATNKTGGWLSTSILSDGKTYNGVLTVDGTGKGHALAYNGATFATQEIIVIHSAGRLTEVAGEDMSQPDRFTLDQNYPNPFNPTTRIGFRISVTRGVRCAGPRSSDARNRTHGTRLALRHMGCDELPQRRLRVQTTSW